MVLIRIKKLDGIFWDILISLIMLVILIEN